MSLLLEGIRVVETGGWMLGPLAARHLADMGAEVIKIENPAGGDPSRGLESIRLQPITALNYVIELDNRNKRSMTLDLRQEQGKEILYKLVERSDVFITNFQEDVLIKLKIDYDTLQRVNPKLVYAIGTGWGLRGPEKDRPSFDISAFASSGLMATLGEPDNPPVPSLPGMGDHITAVILAYGIMLALFHRERTGVGQMVHASLLGSWIETGGINLQQALTTGEDVPRRSRKSAVNPLWNHYQTKDKKWIQLAMLQPDPYWDNFCEAMGLAELKHDPRFSSHRVRINHSSALISILDQTFSAKDLSEWREQFSRYNIIWGMVNSFADVTASPQVRANGYIVKFNHPSFGEIEVVGIPVELNKTPGKIRTAAPELGQHTEEILLESGYTWADIAKLKQQKVVL